MALDDEQSKRAEQDADKTRRKRECNWQRGVSIASKTLVVCFAIIGVIFLILTLWNCLCAPRSEQVVAQPAALLERLRDVYTALFVGFVGVYFAVLGILLGRKKHLAFIVCLKYILVPNFFKCHAVILLVNFALLEFTPPLLAYLWFASPCAAAAIFQLFWCLGVGVLNMTYMEKPNKASELLNYYLQHDKKRRKMKQQQNKDLAFDFYRDFISCSFPNEKFDILLEAFECKHIKNCAYIENAEKRFLELVRNISIEDNESADYEGFIRMIEKRLAWMLSPRRKIDDVDFDVVRELYKLLYEKLLNFASSQKMSRSFLRGVREPLYTFIDSLPKQDVSKDVVNIVSDMLDRYKDIMTTSFCYCDYEVGQKEIDDFLGMSSLLQIKDFPGEIVNKHTKYAMDLVVRIFELLQFGKIGSRYLSCIPSVIPVFEFSKILIFDDVERYERDAEHEVGFEIYTRNYYIAMLLLYCAMTEKYKVRQFVKKLKYSGMNPDDKAWEYRYVLAGLKNIVKTDFVSIMPDYGAEFESAKKNIEDILSSRITEMETHPLENVQIEDVQMIDYLFLQEKKQKLITAFDSLADKTFDYEQLRPIRTQIEVSWREIVNDSSLHVFKSDYYPLFFRILFDRYVNSSQLLVKDISSLAALPCDDGATLIMPNALFRSLDSVKGVQFTGSDSIRYEQKNFNIERVHTDSDFVVLKSDFNKAFAKPEMNDAASMIDEREMISDISFSTYVYLIFSQNMAMDFPAYRIKGLKNNLSSKDNEKKN